MMAYEEEELTCVLCRSERRGRVKNVLRLESANIQNKKAIFFWINPCEINYQHMYKNQEL